MLKKIIKVIFLLQILLNLSCSYSQKNLKIAKENNKVKNIIYFIVDGMGFNYLHALKVFNGGDQLLLDTFPCQKSITTCPFQGLDGTNKCAVKTKHVTDSAAGATAIATGQKVTNKVLSLRIPGNEKNIETILEKAKEQKKSTGIISTKLFTDATPAAFVAHASSRKETDKILQDIFFESQPNVILGADDEKHRKFARKSNINYEMTFTLSKAMEASLNDNKYLYGGFGQFPTVPSMPQKDLGLPLEVFGRENFKKNDVPKLSQMTKIALNKLNQNKNGFFLMVESGMTDMISHYNHHFIDTPNMPSPLLSLMYEMAEVENTVSVLLDFLNKNKDTLIIVTSDHETGDLTLDYENTKCLGNKGCLVEASFKAEYFEGSNQIAKHTGQDVPFFSIGAGAEKFCAIKNLDHTHITPLVLTL